MKKFKIIIGIYIHIDPLTYEIRYVGQSRNILRRKKAHIDRKKLIDSYHSRWIKRLRRMRLQPITKIVQRFEYISQEDLDAVEIYWIGYFRGIGCPLTNTAEGGLGHLITLETKKRISETLKNRYALHPKLGHKEVCEKKLTTEDRIRAQRTSKRLMDQYGNIYESVNAAARAIGSPQSSVSDIANGRKRSTKGYVLTIIP